MNVETTIKITIGDKVHEVTEEEAIKLRDLLLGRFPVNSSPPPMTDEQIEKIIFPRRKHPPTVPYFPPHPDGQWPCEAPLPRRYSPPEVWCVTKKTAEDILNGPRIYMESE